MVYSTLRTGSKSVLADVTTEDIDCPETIHLHYTSSCLIIDGQALIVAQPEHGDPKQLDQSDGLWKVVMYLFQGIGQIFCP